MRIVRGSEYLRLIEREGVIAAADVNAVALIGRNDGIFDRNPVAAGIIIDLNARIGARQGEIGDGDILRAIELEHIA